MSDIPQKNWAGNVTYQAQHWRYPDSLEALQQMVRDSRQVKVVGSRHSFNTIADCDETIISLNQLGDSIELDTANHKVTVPARMTYGELGQYLQANGYALPNLASLPHISVVGAVMTGTHGSGENNGNLATSVSGLEMVSGTGDIVRVTRDEHGDLFNGMVVSLGALGIVTRITLDVLPTFNVRQDIYVNMPFTQLYDNFDAIQAGAYSVSLFTHWQDDISQVWLKSKVDADHTFVHGDSFYGASRSPVACHPIGGVDASTCTQQLGVSGAWIDRLPHFRMEFQPSHGDEIQTEFFVPRESVVEAMQAVHALRDDIAPLLHVSEIRTMTGDDLWLSPAYGRDTVAFHFTWKMMPDAILPIIDTIQSALEPYAVRPHWGKVFTMPADVIQSRYERMDDFRQLMHDYDPDGKFRNTFIQGVLG